MSGTRGVRTTRTARTVLTRALTVACVVLLCVFGAGPAGASAAESRGSSSAPAEPAEGPSDPAADPEARAALRPQVREMPGARRMPLPVFHVKHPAGAACGIPGWAAEPVLSERALRSVVLRC
ncbi:hypothetical protein [Streptomyces xanthophaeus]|uniref:hypothetical protein n=1 Tax=Streptomyces xanthophaeus TaxID=67385 RepID=UPI00233F3871|nr:hypothetical protein [Streptomyces xanthophaeus]